ncbi:16S rRNA (adenine(1518)-N(6)/adenine(1519)-N(6))-dimethyltransferase RsmA [Fluviispira sanaruensis]|uniref:Ribosomal RNA small subunit methyltransferase A n=1 Tax=Fluviispira sanaruensis TaxID=2493639 RepID=A0A4P2VN35_FLUSA|nr:16S rRNA (adenine(1518)-N(6)/adenine(1519)-N(6))-dimethyltransferase RsmA [Fluviispira sanaruensis]BBH54248.1 16S rRNA (adenine(1518)-N(6)/adenine(1519)-N(6)) - dimethyltransferase RsmA [Fluviispira sanaruensis]
MRSKFKKEKDFKKEKADHAFHLHAKKSLGQNFLRDANVVEKIASSIDTLFSEKEQKYVHEIGPGSGALTLPLLQKNIKIKALEKDERSVQGLNETLAKDFKNQFQVVQTDILKWNPSEDPALSLEQKCICVGNLPYYITSDILFWFCRYYKFYTHGIFMVQNEVADRLQAKPGTKDYGRLSVRIQLFFEVKKLFVVPAKCFVPQPKVDSAIVLLCPKSFSFPTPDEDNAFSSFTTVLFSARRKMLRRALHAQLQQLEEKSPGRMSEFWQLAASHGVTEETRPDVLSPSTILAMHKFFYSK